MFYNETVLEITLGELDWVGAGGVPAPPQNSSCLLADKDDMGLRIDVQLQPHLEPPAFVNLMN